MVDADLRQHDNKSYYEMLTWSAFHNTSSDHADACQNHLLNIRVFLLTIIACFLFQLSNLSAQDLSNIGSTKPVKVSGGISATQVLYGISGMENRRDPYTYYITGNLNFNFFGIISAPLTFTYSNQKMQYQQPFNFNQFGTAPSYKWIKTYIGYNSMTFSPYTLNGYRFMGGGVELTPPGFFRFAAMYGRFNKAVEQDTTNTQIVPSYRRMGYGFKIGLHKENNYIDFILFKAKDDPNSIRTPIASDISPQENLVLSVIGGIELIKHIKITTEFASSALTKDINSFTSTDKPSTVFKYTDFIQTNRVSSSYNNAMKHTISYYTSGFTFGFGYERIGPGYQTLGAYYFNNDLENFTINTTKSLINGKLNIAFNTGLQRNNLDNKKLSTMNRIVSSVNINYTPTQKLNLTGSYSNFSSFTHIRSTFDYINQTSPYANLDTLNFTQITQNGNIGTSYVLGDITSKEKREQLNINVSYQKAADKQNNHNLNSGATFINTNISFNLSLIPKNISFTTAFNANVSDMSTSQSITAGPTLAVTKSFLQRTLNNTISTSYNKAFVNRKDNNTVMNVRLSSTYTIRKKHHITLSMIVLHRSTLQTTLQKFTEFTGTLGYSFSF